MGVCDQYSTDDDLETNRIVRTEKEETRRYSAPNLEEVLEKARKKRRIFHIPPPDENLDSLKTFTAFFSLQNVISEVRQPQGLGNRSVYDGGKRPRNNFEQVWSALTEKLPAVYTLAVYDLSSQYKK